MIQPRLHPELLQWIRQRGRGPAPEPTQSAMDHATASAFQGVFDPRDIEQRFHSFEIECRLAGCSPFGGAVMKGVRRKRSQAFPADAIPQPDSQLGADIHSVYGPLASFLSALQFAVDAWYFMRLRREYYEYLSALLEGTAGARTLKQVFADDARRYGLASARGRLSRRWLELFQTAGGDLYATWYGVFPAAELSVLRSAQSRGNEALIATFAEMSRVLRVIETAKAIFPSLLTAPGPWGARGDVAGDASVTVPRLHLSQ